MVYFNNEYQLPARFDASDVIIDVGAHIGSFAFASLVRGANKVICVEPHPENARQLHAHLADYTSTEKVKFHQAAVWKSNSHNETVSISDFPILDGNFINTGGAISRVSPADTYTVPTISLDTLIGEQSIRLLKLDCEGAEFPIILTATQLHRVKEIVGEYHEYDNYTVGNLVTHLQSLGFRTKHQQHRQYLDGEWIPLPRGYFRAIRTQSE